jgi:hypothetical protein
MNKIPTITVNGKPLPHLHYMAICDIPGNIKLIEASKFNEMRHYEEIEFWGYSLADIKAQFKAHKKDCKGLFLNT